MTTTPEPGSSGRLDVPFVQESVSMCAACGDPYTGSYDDHAATHEEELRNA